MTRRSHGDLGTPLLLGPGSIHVARTDEESLSIDEQHAAVDLYVRLVEARLPERG